MGLRSFAGPLLGKPSGWECPYCSQPNTGPRGSQCMHCGAPKEETQDAPPIPPAPTDDAVTSDVPETSPLDAPLGSDAEATLRQQLVRRYKLIEYYGPAEWVDDTIALSLSGACEMGTSRYVIGTEVSEAAIMGQVELQQRVTEARTSPPRWTAQDRQNRVHAAAARSPLQALEAAMAQDPRYAKTLVDALKAFYERTPAVDITPAHLHEEEAEQLIAALQRIVDSTTPKEAVPA